MLRGWRLYTLVKNGRCHLQQMINNRLDLPKIAVLDLHKVQEKIITNRDASDGHCNARSSASSSTICRLNNFLLLVFPTLPSLDLMKICIGTCYLTKNVGNFQITHAHQVLEKLATLSTTQPAFITQFINQGQPQQWVVRKLRKSILKRFRNQVQARWKVNFDEKLTNKFLKTQFANIIGKLFSARRRLCTKTQMTSFCKRSVSISQKTQDFYLPIFFRKCVE